MQQKVGLQRKNKSCFSVNILMNLQVMRKLRGSNHHVYYQVMGISLILVYFSPDYYNGTIEFY